MQKGVQGLQCVSCRQEIAVDGVSCVACGAPHHTHCHREHGRCASCECAKTPAPFSIAIGPPPSQLPGHVSVALFVMVLFLSLSHIIGGSLSPVGKTVLISGQLERPLGERSAFVSSRTADSKVATRRLDSQRRSWAGDATLGTGRSSRASILDLRTRQGDLRMTRGPGRISGYVNADLSCAKTGKWFELSFGEGRFTDLFLCLDSRKVRSTAPLQRVRVETSLSRATADQVLEDAAAWKPHRDLVLNRSRLRWYRIHGAQPFNRARVAFSTEEGDVRISRFVALEETPPPGRVVECHRLFTVTKLNGQRATLATDTGSHVQLPVRYLSFSIVPDVVAIGCPESNVLLRQGRDGAIGLVHLDGRCSWGFDLGSIASPNGVSSASRSLSPREKEWLEGIGSWTLLSRWNPAEPIYQTVDDSIETGFVLYSDGRVEVVWPDGGGPLSLASVDEFSELLDCARLRSTFGKEGAASVSYKVRRWEHALRRDLLAPGGRAEKEFIRFASDIVLPAIKAFVKPGSAIAVGDRYAMMSRRPFSFSREREGSLKIVMIEKSSVVVRGEGLQTVCDFEEMDLPQSVLPPAPILHVGDELVFFRAQPESLMTPRK